MMSDVAIIDDLMLERRHFVPPKTAPRRRRIEIVDAGDLVVTVLPILERILARVRLARLGAVLVPGRALYVPGLVDVFGPRNKIF